MISDNLWHQIFCLPVLQAFIVQLGAASKWLMSVILRIPSLFPSIFLILSKVYTGTDEANPTCFNLLICSLPFK